MAIGLNSSDFTIILTGEITGILWSGLFSVKHRLSHADELKRDRVRKELLGSNPQDSSQRAKDQAEIFSQLSVRIVKAPQWWTENQSGLGLEDDSIVAKVFEEALRIEREALEEVQKKAEEAKKSLANS